MNLRRNRLRGEAKAGEGRGTAQGEALPFGLCSLARWGWIGDTVCFLFVFWQ